MVTDEEPAEAGARPGPRHGVLERLISTTQDAVVFIDSSGKIMEFNAAAEHMFGYPAAEVMGRKVNMLMAEPYRAEHDGYMQRYEETGKAYAIGRIRQVKGRRKSGENFPLELSVTELPSDSPVRYAAFLRDVSERMAMQEKLLEKERLAAMGTASAMLAHEIGNPLNNISLRAQLAIRKLKKEGLTDHLDSLESIRQEVGRLNRLLQEFRSVAGRGADDFAPCDVGEIAEYVIEQLALCAEQASVRLACEVTRPVPKVAGKEDKLKQMMLNLGKNGIEAMPEGGTLSMRVCAEGDSVVLKVSDTGMGLPEGDDMFELFKTTKPDGTGLGLAVVRQIVASHRGSIAWDSAPGQGTSFTISLPEA